MFDVYHITSHKNTDLKKLLLYLLEFNLTFWWLHWFQSQDSCRSRFHPPYIHNCGRKKSFVFSETTFVIFPPWDTSLWCTCLAVAAVQSVYWWRLCRWTGRLRCRWDHCLRMPSTRSPPDAPASLRVYCGFCRSPAASPCGREEDDPPPP